MLLGRLLGRFKAAAAVALAIISSSVSAAAFKCTDSNGKVSYQQQPCPQGSSAQKLSTGTADWVLVRTSTIYDGQLETFLDVDQIKTIGSLKRVLFKDVMYTFDGPKKITRYTAIHYRYYDCAAGTMSDLIPQDLRAQVEQDFINGDKKMVEWLFPYQQFHAALHQPHGEADIVAKVCGS